MRCRLVRMRRGSFRRRSAARRLLPMALVRVAQTTRRFRRVGAIVNRSVRGMVSDRRTVWCEGIGPRSGSAVLRWGRTAWPSRRLWRRGGAAMARRSWLRWLVARWMGRTLVFGPISVRSVRERTASARAIGRMCRPVGARRISRRLVFVRTGRWRVRGRKRSQLVVRRFLGLVHGRRRRLVLDSRLAVVALGTTCGPSMPRIQGGCATVSSRTRARRGRRLTRAVRQSRI